MPSSNDLQLFLTLFRVHRRADRVAQPLPDALLRNHLKHLSLQRRVLVLEVCSCSREAHPVRHRHCLRWEGIALRLLLHLELIPVVGLARRAHQLRLAQELHVGGAGVAGRRRAALVLRGHLLLVHHHTRAVLLLLPVVNQILLILQVNS